MGGEGVSWSELIAGRHVLFFAPISVFFVFYEV